MKEQACTLAHWTIRQCSKFKQTRCTISTDVKNPTEANVRI